MMDAVRPDAFRIASFIGSGCFSNVYEVEKLTGKDTGCHYALKRFFLESKSAMRCALRERRIFESIVNQHTNPFLPNLLYAMWGDRTPSLVLSKGSGFDLFDLLSTFTTLPEKSAKFYICEILCALEQLHGLGIVHLDVKPENVLFYDDGHVFLSDFDRSFVLSNTADKSMGDFSGTPLFMAPEVAKKQAIDVRSDVWSLGVLSAEIVLGPVRDEAKNSDDEMRMAKSGKCYLRGMAKQTKAFQSFINMCLIKDYQKRQSIAETKCLRFFKYVDWSEVLARTLQPPYTPSDCVPGKDRKSRTHAQLRIREAFNPLTHIPGKSPGPAAGAQDLAEVVVATTGCTLAEIDAAFAQFPFVNPSLYPAQPDLDPILDDVMENIKLIMLPSETSPPGSASSGTRSHRTRGQSCCE